MNKLIKILIKYQQDQNEAIIKIQREQLASMMGTMSKMLSQVSIVSSLESFDQSKENCENCFSKLDHIFRWCGIGDSINKEGRIL